MTAATLTLTEFLLARIAEDEDAAEGVNRGLYNSRVALLPPDLYGLVIRQHPARVLAECEAKRQIVKAFETERVRRDIYNRDFDCGEYDFNQNDLRARLASNAECRGLEIAILSLAAVYSDHPDYRDEWRP